LFVFDDLQRTLLKRDHDFRFTKTITFLVFGTSLYYSISLFTCLNLSNHLRFSAVLTAPHGKTVFDNAKKTHFCFIVETSAITSRLEFHAWSLSTYGAIAKVGLVQMTATAFLELNLSTHSVAFTRFTMTPRSQG